MMLLYNPAFDSYHGALRQYSLLKKLEDAVEIEAIQILDFYLVYPEAFVSFRVPQSHRKWKTFSKHLKSPYRNSSGTKLNFLSFCRVFSVSTSLLASNGLVDSSLLEHGKLALSLDNNKVDALAEPSEKLIARNDGFLDCLTQLYEICGLYGVNGLKARSGLMEYKNDVV